MNRYRRRINGNPNLRGRVLLIRPYYCGLCKRQQEGTSAAGGFFSRWVGAPLSHPMLLTLVSFILLGVVAGLMQSNSQKKSFALEAQLQAFDTLIEDLAKVSADVIHMSDEEGLLQTETQTQKSVFFQTRKVMSEVFVNFQQTFPLDGADWSKRENWMSFHEAANCFLRHLNRSEAKDCKNLRNLAHDLLIIAGKMKHEFLMDAYSKVDPFEYISPF